MRVIEGIEYAAIRGYRPLALDLYLPATEGPTPTVLFLHGGAWLLGSRKEVAPALDRLRPSFFERLVDAGLAVASADYRLSAEATFPAQLHDAKAAVRWLRSNAVEHGLDQERIVAWGASAGGHLAALLGVTGDGDPALEGEVGATGVSSSVRAVVDWYGPADLVALAAHSGGPDHDSPASPEGRLLGGVVSELSGAARAASPAHAAHPAAPPFHIRHGTADKLVPASQSEAMANALAEQGVEVDFALVEGADHMWVDAVDPISICEEALGFLVDVVGPDARA